MEPQFWWHPTITEWGVEKDAMLDGKRKPKPMVLIARGLSGVPVFLFWALVPPLAH